MGVYINGIDIPKEDELIYLVIKNDGIVECVKSIAGSRDGEEPTTLIEIEKAKATYISEPHGRLIDADALVDNMKSFYRDGLHIISGEEAISWVEDDAPTVIEGSE